MQTRSVLLRIQQGAITQVLRCDRDNSHRPRNAARGRIRPFEIVRQPSARMIAFHQWSQLIMDVFRTNAYSLSGIPDTRVSFYSLAEADGGVKIDLASGSVAFDWNYVPFGNCPSGSARFVRRTHFRDGSHRDDESRRIKVPARPAQPGVS